MEAMEFKVSSSIARILIIVDGARADWAARPGNKFKGGGQARTDQLTSSDQSSVVLNSTALPGSWGLELLYLLNLPQILPSIMEILHYSAEDIRFT